MKMQVQLVSLLVSVFSAEHDVNLIHIHRKQHKISRHTSGFRLVISCCTRTWIETWHSSSYLSY